MVAAITPRDIPEAKYGAMPDKVMRCWNTLIAVNFTNGRAVINQNTAIESLMSVMDVSERQVVFDNKWLNIEEIYELAGWSVVYNKPAYNEDYEPTFTFTPKG